MNGTVPGAAAYAEKADDLIQRYEAIAPEDVHQAVLPLFPPAPCRVLDIGAGSGRDAAWFAAKGHSVVAVEPTAAFREAGQRLHPSPAITWIDDSLPGLGALCSARRFDLVMATAIWMHLDADERSAAMARIAGLLAPGGLLIIKIRQGPIPEGRRIFAVGAAETIALAKQNGLEPILHEDNQDSAQLANRVAGVSWTTLAFRAAG